MVFFVIVIAAISNGCSNDSDDPEDQPPPGSGFFSNSIQFDAGDDPTVAGNNQINAIVEMHVSTYRHVWYSVGTLDEDNKKINWGPGHQFTNGLYPSVALASNGVVVEVHEDEMEQGNLYYTVGMVSSGDTEVSWSSPAFYDTGAKPGIAIMPNGGAVVEVHNDEGETALYSHVGTVDAANKTINWGASVRYDNGKEPSVAVNNIGELVEVHMSQNSNTLYYHVGSLDLNSKTIAWESSQYYDTGECSSVALSNYYSYPLFPMSPSVMEVHQSHATTDNHNLWLNLGALTDPGSGKIDWAQHFQYNTGITPCVAFVYDGYMVEIHRSNDMVTSTLWYKVE